MERRLGISVPRAGTTGPLPGTMQTLLNRNMRCRTLLKETGRDFKLCQSILQQAIPLPARRPIVSIWRPLCPQCFGRSLERSAGDS